MTGRGFVGSRFAVALAKVPSQLFAVAVATRGGRVYGAGGEAGAARSKARADARGRRQAS
jgi:hypothetical protein